MYCIRCSRNMEDFWGYLSMNPLIPVITGLTAFWLTTIGLTSWFLL
jgi:hypothetical protein